MKLEIKIKGIPRAVAKIKKITRQIPEKSMEGMITSSEAIKDSIAQVVPHSGTHLKAGTIGVCYHSEFEVNPNYSALEVVCGPVAPYVKILEYGSLATAGEFPFRYRMTKRGKFIIGQWMMFRGILDTFWLRKGPLEPKRYLILSVQNAIERIKEIMLFHLSEATR